MVENEERVDLGESTCRCGHDKEHYMVSARGDYSFGGWILHTIGISAIPTRLTYRCRVCGEVFAETTDPERLKGNLA